MPPSMAESMDREKQSTASEFVRFCVVLETGNDILLSNLSIILENIRSFLKLAYVLH